MLSHHAFFYRAWRAHTRGSRQWLMLLLGPLLLLLPQCLGWLSRVRPSQLWSAALCIYPLYLCLRSLSLGLARPAQERRRGTWDVLRSTGLSGPQIARGMWLETLVPVSVEWLLSGVVLALAVSFELTSPLRAVALMLLFAALNLFHTALGVKLALARSDGAEKLGFAWLAFSFGGSLLVWVWSSALRSGLELVLGLQPCNLAVQLGQVRLYDSGSLRPEAVMGCFFYALGSLMLASSLGRGSLAGESERSLSPTRGRVVKPGSQNPLAYRNRFGASWTTWTLQLLVYSVVLLGPGLTARNSDAKILGLMGHTLFWLFVVVQGATQALCQERERGTLETLMVTRLRASELLTGLLRQTIVPPLVNCLLWTPLALFVFKPAQVAWLLGLTLSFISAWGALALLVSLRASSSARAFQGVYLLLGFWSVGSIFVDFGLLDSIFHWNHPFFSYGSPLMSVLWVAFGAQLGVQGWMESFGLCTLGLHLAAAALCLVWCWRRLSRA